MVDTITAVVGGVDTHRDTHTAVSLDQLGRRLGSKTFPTDQRGLAALVTWLDSYGPISAIGVEGTGSYGAGLARHLQTRNIDVFEVERPLRTRSQRKGKSDPIDAEAAARAVQAGTACAVPKTRNAAVECIRALRVARNGAVKAHTAAINSLRQLVITAPASLSDQLRTLTATQLVNTCARFRPGTDLTHPVTATKHALRQIAQRCQHLRAEITQTDRQLHHLVSQTAPHLLAVHGVGVQAAAQLLATAGDNPGRLHSDAAFAALCGASPIPASSGHTNRHRLNRGGDRAANSALHMIALSRMSNHPATRNYVARRTTEGKTKKEIIRCLKRYIARELLPIIQSDLNNPTHTPLDNP